MAPHVDLYIARITETHDLKDSQENIANAIRTASSKWGCAIISLSLGFKTGIPSIQRALDDAIKMNGVLVFAAASNDGANSGTAYPAKLSSVFCIYSTDSYGNPSLFNPSPTALNGDAFGIIGENVLGAWPSSPASRAVGDSLQRMSGSSIATPIAAALVACVLGLAFKWEAQNVIKLASYEGVRRVLFKMAVKRKEHLYLDPVSFFSRKESNILEDVREVLDLRN
ncbi:hypothetical protein SBRCBS47491_010035 [Sporothrix bragantina]|uniref:Peptidase S8/S53 domain-containing protein n=1 Tax=Sporothrix bragantina TaxID=671064 RepID=A0ABP0CZM1_9PEZI